MAARTKEARCEIRLLKDLQPHPLQEYFFGYMSDHDLRALADDIRRNGLRTLIEVLPSNRAGLPPDTILKGHQRRRALKLIGFVETEVLVRYDLADADAAEIERCFLEDDGSRRHLDKLGRARRALRQYELERKRPRGGLRASEEGEARDRVGKAIGMSGRNLNRYFRVLKTPVEVQNAFRAGKLSLVVAEKVADLGAKQQQVVAERIRKGDAAKAVVSEYLPRSDGRHRKVGDALACFVKGIRQGLDDLDGRVDEVRKGQAGKHLTDLRKARVVIKELIAIAKE